MDEQVYRWVIWILLGLTGVMFSAWMTWVTKSLMGLNAIVVRLELMTVRSEEDAKEYRYQLRRIGDLLQAAGIHLPPCSANPD